MWWLVVHEISAKTIRCCCVLFSGKNNSNLIDSIYFFSRYTFWLIVRLSFAGVFFFLRLFGMKVHLSFRIGVWWLAVDQTKDLLCFYSFPLWFLFRNGQNDMISQYICTLANLYNNNRLPSHNSIALSNRFFSSNIIKKTQFEISARKNGNRFKA